MEGKSVRTARLIRLLVRSVTGAEQPDGDRGLESLVLYVNRIISSRKFRGGWGDEYAISRSILSSLRRDPQDIPASKARVRFEGLFERLADRPLRKKASVLELLRRLSQVLNRSGSGGKGALPMNAFVPPPPIFTAGTARVGAGPASAGPVAAAVRQARGSAVPKPTRGERAAATPAAGRGLVPEEALLRDVVFVLQGIDGRYIKFDSTLDAFAVPPGAGASAPERRMLQLICEGGWLYRRIREYLQASIERDDAGLVEQSFCGAMQSELTQYYRQIATLESEMASKAARRTGAGMGGGAASSRLSLRGVYLWSLQLIDNLRLMAMLVDSVRGKKGGGLVSALLHYTKHGDPSVAAFVENVAQQTCAPLFKQITQWMGTAELTDPFEEFFVVSKRSVPAERVWQDRYSLSREMVPSFIDEALARKILNVGKSISFIQNTCARSRDAKAGRDAKARLQLTAIPRLDELVDTSAAGARRLRGVVDKAAAAVNAQLMRVIHRDFGFRRHCLALKKYLLLGQGDFVERLMDTLNDELDQPATSLLRHNLVSLLKRAIQQTNAQYEERDVLSRLDVRVLRGVQGDVGWDVFSLDYHVGPPLNTILHKDAIEKYLRVFNFLWQLKRVDHALVACWSLHNNSSFKLKGATGSIAKMLKKGFLVRSEMQHFVSNMSSYVMFEVLECAWADFEEELRKAADLDSVIAAHEQYLKQILSGAMLADSGAGAKAEGKASAVGGFLLADLKRLFNIILEFVHLQEKVFESAEIDFKMDMEYRNRMYARQQRGKWGQSASQEATESRTRARRLTQEMGTRVYDRINELESSFLRLLNDFRSRLTAHASSSAQFLDVRLDFNEFYDGKRRAALAQAAKSKSLFES